LPPTLDAVKAGERLKEILEKDPPYNAEVSVEDMVPCQGWNSPTNQKWLDKLINETSQNIFSKPCLELGLGGSIPLMNLL